MLLKLMLTLFVFGAVFTLTYGYANCPECLQGKFDCRNIYPNCGPKINHLCFSNGLYYCAEPKLCPECSVPGFKCENKHPFCNKETTTSLCYYGKTLLCVEKIVPTTTAPTTTQTTTLPTTTTPKPTTTAPTTPKPTTLAPTTPVPTTTVNPLTRCLTPGITSGCFLQCTTPFIPLIGKVCMEGTCCVTFS